MIHAPGRPPVDSEKRPTTIDANGLTAHRGVSSAPNTIGAYNGDKKRPTTIDANGLTAHRGVSSAPNKIGAYNGDKKRPSTIDSNGLTAHRGVSSAPNRIGAYNGGKAYEALCPMSRWAVWAVGHYAPTEAKSPMLRWGVWETKVGATSKSAIPLLLFTKIDETFFKSQQGKEAYVKLGGLGKIGAW